MSLLPLNGTLFKINRYNYIDFRAKRGKFSKTHFLYGKWYLHKLLYIDFENFENFVSGLFVYIYIYEQPSL